MICINCFHAKTSTANSRKHKKQPTTWRRRHCERCGLVFTTYERPSLDDVAILQHDSSTTPFNLGKLTTSIARSFHHDKQAADHYSLLLAQTVEIKLIMHGKSLSADDIAALAHETLKHFDPVAAVQYAAQHDLMTLRKRPGRPAAHAVRDRSAPPSPSR